jgi:4-amino-4-deoxy-L-arabinose transferase-like glycosyltransferase
VLLLLALLAALTFRDYGLGWDDLTHAQYGELLLALYSSGFRDTRALSFVNLYLYGGGFDMAAAALAKILPLDPFELRRLLGAAIGIAGLAVTWRIARRAGSPLAGLIALLLLATCPLYYGHMFINPKDAPFAVAMALFLLGLTRAFEQYPKPSPATVVILGLGFGLAIGSRVMAGFGVFAARIDSQHKAR